MCSVGATRYAVYGDKDVLQDRSAVVSAYSSEGKPVLGGNILLTRVGNRRKASLTDKDMAHLQQFVRNCSSELCPEEHPAIFGLELE